MSPDNPDVHENLSPQISVVISVFNEERWIEKCLRSLLNQSVNDIEIICVDDGSTDRSPQIIARMSKYDNRILPIYNQHNIGLTPSLNKALAHVKGKYIARVDADTFCHPDRFEIQRNVFEQNPSVVLVGSAVQHIDERYQKIYVIGSSMGRTTFYFTHLFKTPIAHSSAMFLSEIVIGGGEYYDESFGVAQDHDMWTRLLTYGDGIQLSNVLVSSIKRCGISNLRRNEQRQKLADVCRASVENLPGSNNKDTQHLENFLLLKNNQKDLNFREIFEMRRFVTRLRYLVLLKKPTLEAWDYFDLCRAEFDILVTVFARSKNRKIFGVCLVTLLVHPRTLIGIIWKYIFVPGRRKLEGLQKRNPASEMSP